ncbi:NusA-like transcription termination signal-binding factor [Candidatus Woesearchaeota archaeon]|nr:NusA-like transcription termination signal-binding factor [Candidatus Woesearchaeota archaeon]MBW3013942.1 NusA-like transcription termination signal-binding factor [Candidatus Woesearchaeota archaeon]
MASMQYMSSFEKITRSKLKDFFQTEDMLIFIVQPLQLRRALGPQGKNAKMLRQKFNKKIKIVEYNPNVITFIKNMIHPLKAVNITDEDGVVTIEGPDRETKALLIGRNASNLRALENAVKRYFSIKEIKVV